MVEVMRGRGGQPRGPNQTRPMIDELAREVALIPSVRAVIVAGPPVGAGAVTRGPLNPGLVIFADDPARLATTVPEWTADFGGPIRFSGEPPPGARAVGRLGGRADSGPLDFVLFHTDRLRAIALMAELPPWLDVGYRVLHDPDGLSDKMVPPSGRGYAGR